MDKAFLHRVKAAQRDLIEYCGGITRVAEKCGYSKSVVGRWNHPGHPDLMPLDAVVALESDATFAPVTAVLADVNGRRLSDPDQDFNRAASREVMSAVAAKMQLDGNLAIEIAQAIADGHVSPTEATVIDRLASESIRATSQLRNALAEVKARDGDQVGLKLVAGEGV